MSEKEIKEIIHAFDNRHYCQYILQQFHASEYARKWSHENILRSLNNAFSLGFGGMHFIPNKYEACIQNILEEYFGSDHYIAYRRCDEHGMLILEPNFHKLKISPLVALTQSYTTNENIHALQHKETFISFCFS